ncbi:MAG TPA: TIGR00730 family Rossman fold protein [Capsulimonadaceae bacterium]|nr:TIGR00730 family Rossman fold protein [Capsulimonadaceae bacterium]
MKSICVYCGANVGARPSYTKTAQELGRLLAGEGLRLIYGGGHVGLMGVIADATLGAGGEAVGVIPKALADRELAYEGLTELHVVSSMHERKTMMAELSDGFIAMPGGFGTFEEFCEILTWAQLGMHQKPSGLLNVAGYYDPLLALFDRAVSEGFVRNEHRAMVLTAERPEALLQMMRDYRPPAVDKWIDLGET